VPAGTGAAFNRPNITSIGGGNLVNYWGYELVGLLLITFFLFLGFVPFSSSALLVARSKGEKRGKKKKRKAISFFFSSDRKKK